MNAILWTALSFLLGSIPFSVILGRVLLGKDIRQYGDGNPGGTNVGRASGSRLLGALAIILDMAKGALPVALAHYVFGVNGWGLTAVMLAPILGHAYSPFLKFKGGKAIAVTFGVWTALTVPFGPFVMAFSLLLLNRLLTAPGWAVMAALLVLLALLAVLGLTQPPMLAAWFGTVVILASKHLSDLSRPPQLRFLARVAQPHKDNSMLLVLALLASAALLGMLGIMASNLILFPRLQTQRRTRWAGAGPDSTSSPLALPALKTSEVSETSEVWPPATPRDGPLVSVLIPARNEAAVIAGTVQRIIGQTYHNFELIVLDDNSEDGTGELARKAAQGDSRLRVVGGKPLPPGWAGKNWACHQLALAARGGILLFTDADTIWAPEGLAALVAEMVDNGADLQTVWPTQITESWAERLTVPNMALVVMAYLPVLLTHFTHWAAFSAANGQVMAFRRAAYDRIQGHAGVRGEVVEDVKLARHIKSSGLRLRMADGNRFISCRMYIGWPTVRNGFAKSIVGGYGSIFGVILSIIFHLTVFLLPAVWLVLGWLNPQDFSIIAGPLSVTLPGWPLWPAALTAVGMGIRATTAWFTHQRSRDALLMPVTVVVMTAISVLACWWQIRYGGPVWKGRLIRAEATHE